MQSRHRLFSPTQYIRIYVIVTLVSYTVTRAVLESINPNPAPRATSNSIRHYNSNSGENMGGKKGGGENTKKAAGNAKKAEAAAAKQAVADAKQAAVEDEKWSKGAKTNKKVEDAEAKKNEAAAKKAERDRLLAEEEASQPTKAKGAGKKTAEKKTRGTLDLSQLDGDTSSDPKKKTSAINASGIDNALDALSLTASSNDIKLERHPERRFKAAYEAFEAWRLPEIIAENKGSSLRRNQMVEMCRREFDKRPENPFNQTGNVAHNATREELAERRADIRTGVENRLSEK